MIKLQNPSIPPPTMAIEIDKAIYNIMTVLNLNLSWLTHGYARAYRFIEKGEGRLYFPEVYVGGDKNPYHRVTPDNDKKGMCFFVVGKEQQRDFVQFSSNWLKWEVGIVFWVNLKLIDPNLLQTEEFTQNLIRDARRVLTERLGGLGFRIQLKNAEREFKEIYKEFTLDESNDYLRAPYSGFRVNCEIEIQEGCEPIMFDPAEALLQNVSNEELTTILLPTIDFSDDDNFNSLTEQQKADLLAKLQP